MDKVHYSSDSPNWGTPQQLFDELDAEFHFDLDVCADDDNSKVCMYYSEADNCLEKDWSKVARRCWMNPPYGEPEFPCKKNCKKKMCATRGHHSDVYVPGIIDFIQKAWIMKQHGVTTVCLVPARTDTEWWSIFYDHDTFQLRDKHDEMRLIKGRIKFEGAANSAPFPSAIIVLQGIVPRIWCPKCQNGVYLNDPCTENRSCGLAAAHAEWKEKPKRYKK